MKNAESRFPAPIWLIAALLLSSCVGAVVQSSFLPQDRGALLAAMEPAAATVLYKQSTAFTATSSTTPVPIPGMSLTLPVATTSAKHALLTFNAPTAQLNFDCNFQVVVGAAVVANESIVGHGTTMAGNIVVRVALTAATQSVGVNYYITGTAQGDSCSLLNFYSLSAILTT